MPIRLERRGRIAVVTIDRPEAMNALDVESNEWMARVWEEFRDDEGLWVGILTGAGDRAFCAGADLRSLIPARIAAVKAGRPAGPSFGGITRDFVSWKPIIAAINGYCLAGGLELALACDLRIAADTARFALTEVRWGFIPGGGGTQRLPRAIPLGKAMEMILTGEQIDAAEAERLGLVNRVVALADVHAEALKTAELLLERGPLALRAAKRAVLHGLDMPLSEGLELEQRLFEELLRTEDAAEGPRAFAEKRKPSFRAR